MESKAVVKGATKTSNLFFKIAAKWVEKWCCTFHHSLINSVLISFLQLLQLARICCWESRAKLYFCSKNSTCCKCILPVNLPIPCIVSLPHNFIPSEVVIHATCNNQICQETGLIHGWLNVPHRLSTHFATMLQDRLHLFVAFCPLAYCAFQKHTNSKVQKPTDVFCYVFCCRRSS